MAVYVDPKIRNLYNEAKQYYIGNGYPFHTACKKAKESVLAEFSDLKGKEVAASGSFLKGSLKFIEGLFTVNALDSMLGQCILDDING